MFDDVWMFIWTLLYEDTLADASEVTVNRLRPKTIIIAKLKFFLKFFILIDSFFLIYYDAQGSVTLVDTGGDALEVTITADEFPIDGFEDAGAAILGPEGIPAGTGPAFDVEGDCVG